ncbi:hypothetical protein [Chryseolinea soli]|uniref:Uncharacterized protein n=1 Tax=Chryseolinea soli TaxID=2321403 RepID=A0A385SQV7_9BACT|nr:hypothetical protein [Chryseolinea soli]AYB33364.1 hypothetical protein D4L85_23480 [Chryseolinea soli]
METTILSSSGFTIDNFYFESFDISKGEYLSIDFYTSHHDFKLEEKLLEVLSGKKKMNGVRVNSKINPVVAPIAKPGPAFLSNKTSFQYLLENGTFLKEEIFSLLKKMNIEPNVNIYRLGANERRLLALEAAISLSKNIIISTSGIDYNGIDEVRRVIQRICDDGAVLEISFATSRGREYLIDGARYKRIAVKEL